MTLKISQFLGDELSVTKGSVKVPIGGLVSKYREKYNRMIRDPHRKFQYHIYQYPKEDSTIIVVKVPSETVKDFQYDIVFQLSYTDRTTKLEDCNIKVFSNSPSYVYGFFYIHYHLDLDEENDSNKRNTNRMLITNMTKKRKVPKNHLVINGFEKKVGSEAINDPPTTRNTLGLPLWDKTLYYALFYLQRNVSFQEIRSTRRTITERQLLDSVRDFDRLMTERSRLEKRQKEARERVRKSLENTVKKTETAVRKANRPTPIKSPKKMTSARSTMKKPKTMQRMK